MAVSNLDVGRPIFTATNDAVTGKMYVKYVRYIGTASTAADETATMTDTAGKEVMSTIADGADFIDVMPIWGIVDGLKVSSITSGKFVAYLR